jgi:hypothetical protein
MIQRPPFPEQFLLWSTTASSRWYSASCAAKPKHKYTQNFQDDRCSAETGVQSFAPWWFPSVSPRRVQHLLPRDNATVYDFASGYNHGCTLYITLFSRVRFNVSGMVLSTQGIRTLRHMKSHEVSGYHFKTDFQLTCGVEHEAVTWLDHMS